MAIYPSFAQDWNQIKNEMKKLGHKKPATIETWDGLIIKIDKRVSSGISDALKNVDKAQPRDPKNPSDQEIAAYQKAANALSNAVNSELAMIKTEIDKLRDNNTGKVDQKVKDDGYRALKIFKSKLDHYEAAAQQELVEYQHTQDKTLSEKKKTLTKFTVEAKQELTKMAATIKKWVLVPGEAIPVIEKDFMPRLNKTCKDAEGLAHKWPDKNLDDFHDRTETLYKHLERLTKTHWRHDKVLPVVGKEVKQALDALAKVKTS